LLAGGAHGGRPDDDHSGKACLCIRALLAASFWLSARSRADTMEEFYCGKLVVLLIASGVGGGNQREQNVHPASQLGRSTYRARETGLDTKHRENRPSLPSRCPTA
jgi:hypothetical protein